MTVMVQEYLCVYVCEFSSLDSKGVVFMWPQYMNIFASNNNYIATDSQLLL